MILHQRIPRTTETGKTQQKLNQIKVWIEDNQPLHRVLKLPNQHSRTKELSQEEKGSKNNRESEEQTMHLKGQGKKRILRRIKTGLIVKNKLMIKLRSFAQPRRKLIQNSKGLQSRSQQQYRKYRRFNLKDSLEFSNPQQV